MNARSSFFQYLAGALFISLGGFFLAGCADDPPKPPSWDPTVQAGSYDKELSRYGITAVPVEQINPAIVDNAVQSGAVIFETTKSLIIDGKVMLVRKSFLAARHPFAYTPYYTVYAVKDAKVEKWLPACGIVAWPRPPQALSDNNVWLSFISFKQP